MMGFKLCIFFSLTVISAVLAVEPDQAEPVPSPKVWGKSALNTRLFRSRVRSATLSSDEQDLYNRIMEYRRQNGLPSVPISPSLTKVAQVHSQDLNQNKPYSDRCNMHSWSSKGSWSACCYTSDHAQASCMWNKPREITGFRGNGFEISHGYLNQDDARVTPEGALNERKPRSQ